MVERATIVLAAAEGSGTTEIARQLLTRPARVSKWRTRFARDRLTGLVDAPRPGARARYDESTERRILAALDERPPAGHATWTGSLLATTLGDVSSDQVWRTLRRHGISLRRRRSWCLSTDPEFTQKAADIVGLYLDPPENALVLCVDEKPGIQALERSQGWLRLPDGRSLTGFAREYRRHGTTTLFAALEVASGLVQTGHHARRRRREFLDFMNEVLTAHPDPGLQLHVVLDNLKYPQAHARPLAGPPSERPLPLHPDPCELAQPGRGLVQHPRAGGPPRSEPHLSAGRPRRDRAVRRRLQRHRHTVRVAATGGPPSRPHSPLRRLTQLSTSTSSRISRMPPRPLAMTVSASGAVGISTTVLLTAADVDAAIRRRADHRAPGA
jgi:transposase